MTDREPTCRREPRASFIELFDEDPSDHREGQIRAGFAARQYDAIAWGSVTSSGTGDLSGYSLKVDVMSDALKFDGVRIIGSFDTAQWLADVSGWTLMTSWIAGLVSEQTDAPLTPTTLPPGDDMMTKSYMLDASAQVDAKLAAYPGASLVLNPGKDWVLSVRFAEEGDNSEGIPFSEAAANNGLYLKAWSGYQVPPGLQHGLTYSDYSQTLRLVGAVGLLTDPDGCVTRVRTRSLVMDAKFAPLMTGAAGQKRGGTIGEGVLAYDRHPAIAPYCAASPPRAGRG